MGRNEAPLTVGFPHVAIWKGLVWRWKVIRPQTTFAMVMGVSLRGLSVRQFMTTYRASTYSYSRLVSQGGHWALQSHNEDCLSRRSPTLLTLLSERSSLFEQSDPIDELRSCATRKPRKP